MILKFFTIFNISFSQEFSYRANFIMWRVRNVLSIFLVFFLWDIVFTDPSRVLFGYDRAKMMTYVLGLIFVKAMVLSSRTVDVSSEISSGDLVNMLLRPINYFKYWMTRDISSKTLNLLFAILEMSLFFIVLKPSFFLQTNPIFLVGFIASIILAALIFFNLLFIVSSVTFWTPEMAWGAQFLLTVVIVEFLSGSIFPLDILPNQVLQILNLTPFPYMIYFPLQVYLGKMASLEILKGLLVSGVWGIILFIFMKYIWSRGLRVYQAYGR